MANEYAITAAADRVSLDTNRRGQTTFTISNRTSHPLPTRARIVTQRPEVSAWFTVHEPERTLPPSETQQFTVSIAVPATAQAGDYAFRLDAIGVENPDEQHAQGQSVVVAVPAPVVTSKGFPWWIFAVGGLVLLVALVAVVLVLLGDGDDDDGNGGVSPQISPVIAVPDEPDEEDEQDTDGAATETVAQGNVVLTGVAFLDLDGSGGQPGGSVSASAGPETDIMVGNENIEQSMLAPVNDTLIGRAGASEPGNEGCAALSLGSEPVSLEQLSAGDHYCIQTTDGNLSQLRVDEFGEGTGGFRFQIEVTWMTFAA